jgi:tetratricopeptide (TPR) repeat protein
MTTGRTFVVLALLLAALGWWSSTVDPQPVRRAGRGGAAPDAEQASSLSGAFLSAEDVAWSEAHRNIFQAPRETENLPPLEMSTPPLPALPHPGLPLLPTVGGALEDRSRFVNSKDAAAQPAKAKAARGADENPAGASSAEAGTGSAASDLDTVTVPGPLSFAERLRLSTEERLKRDRIAAEAAKAQQEQRAAMDMLQWISGEQIWGSMEMLDRKRDRYDAKRAIDALRANGTLSEDDRRRQLDALQIVFKEHRGNGKPITRHVLSGSQIARVEFAATPLTRYHLRRREVKDDDLSAQEGLARDLFEAGEFETAARHVGALHGRGLENLRTHTLAADCEQKLLRYEGERAVLTRGLEKFPEDAGLLAREGQLLLRLGLLPEAREAFKRALDKDAACALAHLGLARIALRDGDARGALLAARAAESGTGLSRGGMLDALILQGEAQLILGEEGAARTCFDKALDMDGRNPQALAGNAALALLGGGVDAAKALVDRGRAAHPYDGRLALLDAVLMYRKGAFAEARALFQVAAELDPLLAAKAFSGLSALEEKAGNLPAALGQADAALQADPGSLDARAQRARTLFLLGDFNAARDEYLAVLAKRPRDADLLAALGDCHLRLGGWTEAARFYVRTAAADANYPDLAGRQLLAAVKRRRFAEAEEAVRRLSTEAGRAPFMQAVTAAYHYARGQTEEALRRLRVLSEQSVADLSPWAAQSLSVIEDNLNKEVWTDAFGRSGGQLQRAWQKDVGTGYAKGSGVNVAIDDGRVVLRAKEQKGETDQPTSVWQERMARQVYSVAADFALKPERGVYSGLYVMAFNKSSREPDRFPGLMRRDGGHHAHVGLQVAVSPEGDLVWRRVVQGKASEWAPSGSKWPESGKAQIAVQLVDAQKSIWRVLLDGQAAMADVEVPGLARRPGNMELGLFAQAGVDRPVEMAADNFTLVTWKK